MVQPACYPKGNLGKRLKKKKRCYVRKKNTTMYMTFRPMIELTLPSSLDPTLCPPGKHVCLMFTQYTKYTLSNAKSWDDDTKSKYANMVLV
jgi:phytoene dehydrogenase-like protein